MADDSDKKAAAMAPSWQQAASPTPPNDNPSSHTASGVEGTTMDQARRFLQDEVVRLSSREKKIEFLQSKGIEEADINKLLEETDAPASSSATTTTTTNTTQATSKGDEQQGSSTRSTGTMISTSEPEKEQETRPDHPPIITYPEFLTEPAKPPPLITASGLLYSLGIVASLSTLAYGATKYLVSPMVGALTEARIDLHDSANKNLSQLVEKLEHAVSEIPASYHTVGKKNTADAHDDDSSDSSYDDPTELFHRDVGVQTSPPPTPDPYHYNNNNNNYSPLTGQKSNNNNTQQQADKLRNIISSVRGLSHDLVSQAEDLAGTKDVLDRFGQDLHALTYPPESFGGVGGSSYLYGTARAEPDDEIRRVKNNIRGVKGVLLSTRSFPAGTR